MSGNFTALKEIVFEKHGIKRHHLFADDKQLLTPVKVSDMGNRN